MNAGGETADQFVRMNLQGIEIAANVALKAGGMASKSLAVTLYAILTDRKKVKGKARLNTMLKSGKELKVFAIQYDDLKLFVKEAKRYGVMYCVLKEKHKRNGICDILVRAEDAAKITRIIDKFELATVDTKMLNDKTAEMMNQEAMKNVPPLGDKEHDEMVRQMMESMKQEKDGQNPSKARTKKDATQFEHTSTKAKKGFDTIKPERPSVRDELRKIKQRRTRKARYKNQKQKQKAR